MSECAEPNRTDRYHIYMSGKSPRHELMRRVMTFHRANKEAMAICDKGVDDYVASRCLLLNGFLAEGLTLAAQAVEKILKCQYRIRGGTKPFARINGVGLGHCTPQIAVELRDDPVVQFDLSRFNALFDRLVINYELRYPDNWEKRGLTRWLQGGDELEEIDELMLYLFDDFPIPHEVNVLTCYFGIVSNYLAQPHNQFEVQRFKWLCEQNRSIDSNWDRIRHDCAALNQIAVPALR